ncbi:MAG: acyltransferase [Alphaproteobacteria bacterium]|nr:acyltransferase [Alphaproteobacteria bacterium]
MKKLIRYLTYFLYLAFFRFTPGPERPYALFFPALRRLLARGFLDHCGKNLKIGSQADISASISIGNNSELGSRCIIEKNVRIGDDVMMGPDVKILTHNHHYDRLDTPIRLQGLETFETTIGNDVWIGANVTILPNKKIGHHAILGAGAVITKDVPDGAIVAGNPARTIKMRKLSH